MSSSKAWFQASRAFRFDSESNVVTELASTGPQWEFTLSGLTAGAVLVERLRTFGGKLPDLTLNKDRLAKGAVCFQLPSEQIQDVFEMLLERLVAENRILEATKELPCLPDVGLVVLFIPGNGSHWTAFAHLSEIPYKKLSHWYTFGVDLTLIPDSFSTVGIIPADVKHRSRLQYWLADRQATTICTDSQALLMDRTDAVCDTSFANIVLITAEREWVTPSSEYAHLGVTIRRTELLLASEEKSIRKRRISIEDILHARELFVIGSTGIAAPVRQVVMQSPELATAVEESLNAANGNQGPIESCSPAEPYVTTLIWERTPNHIFLNEPTPQPEGWMLVNRLWQKIYGVDVVDQATGVLKHQSN